MAVKVVDASALVALIFVEAEAEEITDRLDGAVLIAPALLWFELTNACLTKLRRNPDQRDAILRQFASQAAMTIEIHDIDHAKALALAEQCSLSAYDASYLWLARELDADLVTLDRRLAHAAEMLRQA
jgi:predicted nucleic acid-binding protein